MLERFFIFLMVIFTIGLSTGVSSARQVELKSNYNTSVQNIGLNREETNWLAHKKTLVVGTWLPEVSPIVYQNSGEYYRGVNADYLALMQKNLNLKIIIKQYDNEQEALAALALRRIQNSLFQIVGFRFDHFPAAFLFSLSRSPICHRASFSHISW